MDNQERRILKAKKPQPKNINLGPPVSLIKLINEGNRLDAISAIRNNNFIKDEHDLNGSTPLILACEKNMEDIALPLIDSGNSEPEKINYFGESALTISCAKSLKSVARKLVQINSSLVNITTPINQTPLILACSSSNMEDIALDIFNTGKSIPEQEDDTNSTALIMACKNSLSNIALKLVESGKSNWFIRDNNGMSAIEYCEANGLDDVINALQKLDIDELIINLNNNGFDAIELQEENINKYLLEDTNNICFKYNNKYYLTNTSYIDTQLQNDVNIIYRCIFDGDNKYDSSDNLVGYDYTSDKNIVYSTEYFLMSSLIGIPIAVYVSDLKDIITHGYSTNLYLLSESGSFPAIISVDYVNGGSGVGANHCQPGKKTTKCAIVAGLPSCEKINDETRSVLQFTSNKNTENTNDNKPLEVKIQYKTKTVIIQISDNTTIGDLKNMFLEKLVSEGDIDNVTNKNVRLIYIGKIYGNDKNEQVVSSLPNFSSGITMAGMVQTTTGGKKRSSRKTKKLYKNNKKYQAKFKKTKSKK